MQKLKVIEFEGLAPSVFLGLYFADQGAEVIFVARKDSPSVSIPFHTNILNRNKKSVVADFKNPQDFAVIQQLLKEADVLIDPYRPGVLEKLKLGPKDLSAINSRIILLRVSGYGQTGPNKMRPGHDLNYLSVSGILPLLNKKGENQFPMNYMADFVSASLGITGVLAALRERDRSGVGGVVDCSLTDGCTYLAQNLMRGWDEREEGSVKTFKIGETEYIASGEGAEKLSELEVVNLIKEKNYVRVGHNLEISKVLQTSSFDLNHLTNPFSNLQPTYCIRNKGDNTAEIFTKYAPKL